MHLHNCELRPNYEPGMYIRFITSFTLNVDCCHKFYAGQRSSKIWIDYHLLKGHKLRGPYESQSSSIQTSLCLEMTVPRRYKSWAAIYRVWIRKKTYLSRTSPKKSNMVHSIELSCSLCIPNYSVTISSWKRIKLSYQRLCVSIDKEDGQERVLLVTLRAIVLSLGDLKTPDFARSWAPGPTLSGLSQRRHMWKSQLDGGNTVRQWNRWWENGQWRCTYDEKA